MAHKKGQGKLSQRPRFAVAASLGSKRYGGGRQVVLAATSWGRQVGTVVSPGRNVGVGRAFTCSPPDRKVKSALQATEAGPASRRPSRDLPSQVPAF